MTSAMASIWKYGPGRSLSLVRPRVLAILNVTPDSFSDGGSYPSPDAAADAAGRFVAQGADVIDVGGESTRPGATSVPADEQIRRGEPDVRAIRRRSGAVGSIPISVDTTRAEVARAALDAGADAVNDISAGTDDPGMFDLAARHGAGLILMHRLRPPKQDRFSDQYSAPPSYPDVVAEVRAFLESRASAAIARGVHRECIAVDPGLGFGKSVEDNLALVRGTPALLELGFPVVGGASRKSFVGRVSLERDSRPNERAAGSIAFSVAHFLRGARLFRVHDVEAQVQALRAARAIFRSDLAPPPSPLGRGPA